MWQIFALKLCSRWYLWSSFLRKLQTRFQDWREENSVMFSLRQGSALQLQSASSFYKKADHEAINWTGWIEKKLAFYFREGSSWATKFAINYHAIAECCEETWKWLDWLTIGQEIQRNWVRSKDHQQHALELNLRWFKRRDSRNQLTTWNQAKQQKSLPWYFWPEHRDDIN